ncbi:DUF1521 domain-containing protein [Aquabacterium sp. OR-4]|uniref:DUF1521 domain-containing protein n=1 Tax=Aquabacterium sp. OR-4 TaxID=2978127 RepID=UPI0021B32E7B|nr:DUF1521 domain-containing protein [Aquabacterium sp. OR-4]MDT7837986.1 DUF1521 domain-containing protein [Aquabacterium sp. OR-4]
MNAIQANSPLSNQAMLPIDRSNPTNASTQMQGGRAVFENDNYRISAGDDNTVNIVNKNTGESYNVWGDPHVNIDGKHAFDFWGTTTFQLEDGTKLTIDTTQAGNGMTLASKLTITNGDYGVQISGVDTNTRGDLKIDEAAGWGETLDWVRDDGNVLHENPAGQGFLGIDAQGTIKKVDQAYINQTDLDLLRIANAGNAGNPPAQATVDQGGAFMAQLFNAFSGLVQASLSGAFLGALNQLLGDADSGRALEPAQRDSHRFTLTMVRLEF